MVVLILLLLHFIKSFFFLLAALPVLQVHQSIHAKIKGKDVRELMCG
jgi:hypothetical protein